MVGPFHPNFPKMSYKNTIWSHNVNFVDFFKVVSVTSTSLQNAASASSASSPRKKPVPKWVDTSPIYFKFSTEALCFLSASLLRSPIDIINSLSGFLLLRCFSASGISLLVLLESSLELLFHFSHMATPSGFWRLHSKLNRLHSTLLLKQTALILALLKSFC